MVIRIKLKNGEEFTYLFSDVDIRAQDNLMRVVWNSNGNARLIVPWDNVWYIRMEGENGSET